MDVFLILLVAFLASGLTLISGFGLGTMMLPVFALFFPLEVAVGLTAVVHLLNNLFKMGLLFRWVDRAVWLWFGIPGIFGAFLGANLMLWLGETEGYHVNGRSVSFLALAIGILMIFFAVTEIFPRILQVTFKRAYLVPGGVLSGFFGGLSGHQGALRSMFLIKANLSKEQYIATGVAIALLVDLTRIPTYGLAIWEDIQGEIPLLMGATLSAFLGAFIGKRLIPKITYRTVQITVGSLMILLGIGMILGWI
ncbi:MAG: sulfite exporter TauE/SafE family protein [Bacteroidota bacterium]|nr:sulfite exporter TauE/SafE family protein [Bacteroidota bacterium]